MGKYVFYGYRGVPAAEKRRLVHEHFETIANRYDLADHILSFGLHLFWRRRAMKRLGLKCGATVLDLCTGTGDLAILAAKDVGPSGRIVGCDLSQAMMAAGRRKVARAGFVERLAWVRADAECLGFARDSFDAVLVGYGLRNFVFLEQGLREICRVLKPSGRFLAMEFALPESAWLRTLYHWYSFRVLPRAGQLITGVAEPFEYLAESIRVFPQARQIRIALQRNGLTNVSSERLSKGLAVLYYAEKS